MNAHFDLPRFRAIAEQLDVLCGDDDQCFRDMIEGETQVKEIVSRLHGLIATDKELIDGIAAREEDLRTRKARIGDRMAARKAAIGKYMRAVKLTSLELPEASYNVREGKPTLKVVDPQGVPEEFQRIKREPDKTAINEAFNDAEELPNWLVRELPRDVVTARTK